MLNWIVWNNFICIKMYLALNNQQAKQKDQDFISSETLQWKRILLGVT